MCICNNIIVITNYQKENRKEKESERGVDTEREKANCSIRGRPSR